MTIGSHTSQQELARPRPHTAYHTRGRPRSARPTTRSVDPIWYTFFAQKAWEHLPRRPIREEHVEVILLSARPPETSVKSCETRRTAGLAKARVRRKGVNKCVFDRLVVRLFSQSWSSNIYRASLGSSLKDAEDHPVFGSSFAWLSSEHSIPPAFSRFAPLCHPLGFLPRRKLGENL